MSIFSRMSHVNPSMGPGLGRFAGSTLVGGAAAYGIGQLHGRYRDTAHIEHLPAAVGVGGKVAVLLASAFGVRGGFLLGSLDGIAQAGIDAYALSKGIEHGLKASGRRMLVLAPGAEARGLVSDGGRDTVLGQIPPPSKGKYLSRNQIADLARHV